MDKKRLRLKFERCKYEFGLDKIAQYVAGLKQNLTLSGCGFGRVKFEVKFVNLTKVNSKFERKAIRRSLNLNKKGPAEISRG